jgi:hypothetical protein
MRSNGNVAHIMFNVSHRLSYMDQHEEVLVAVQEVVELRRKLVQEEPASFNPPCKVSQQLLYPSF